MTTIFFVVLFTIILSILIVVHEAGHFLMARRVGVAVEQFSLGFGPKLFSIKAGGTEYCLCAIPLGGYVKMTGEERAQCKGKNDEYFSKSPGHRALIVLMGPVVNYFLAYLCFVLVFMIGFIDLDASNKAVPAKVGSVVANWPAAKAGVKAGDVITRINETPVTNWVEMQDKIMDAPANRPITMIAKRDGATMVAYTIMPESEMTKDIFGRAHKVSRVGIKAAELSSKDALVIRHYGFWGAWKQGAIELATVTTRTYQALWQIATGERSAKEGMTGLIGIFFIIKFAAGVGVSYLLHVVGVVSASLAIFNLLPVIPLDGGHMACIAVEKLRRKPLDAKTEDIIARIGFGLIIALAVFVFYLDFERIGLVDRITGLFHK